MLELWFDFSCPYAYLASHRARALGVPIDWRPMLLGGVFRGIGAGDGPMATLGPAKARHNNADMQRWAALWDVPFRMPAAHPMRTVRALRVLLGLPHSRWPAAIEALYAAYWRPTPDGTEPDITRDDVIVSSLRAAGIPDVEVTAALAAADTDAIKTELRHRTDEAIELGIFGAPAWIVRGRAAGPILIWGQDRMPWVEAVLAGWDPEAGPPPADDGTKAPRPLRDLPAAHAGATLDVYFDVSSPFAYLGLTQLPALVAAGVEPRLIPILLGGLFRDIGQVDVPLLGMTPPKMRHFHLEMTRWASWWGETLEFPKKFPQRTITAQRLILLAADHGWRPALGLAIALGRAMWAEQRDLEDPQTLRTLLEREGLPGELVERTSEPAVKARLIANTTAARDAGVFGVPTFVVDGTHLFWGQDRLDFVVKTLAGWTPPA